MHRGLLLDERETLPIKLDFRSIGRMSWMRTWCGSAVMFERNSPGAAS